MNRNKRFHDGKIFLNAMIVYIFCSFAVAVCANVKQATSTSSLASLSLEELMNIKVETVTTASKYSQKASQAPSSVSVITSEDFRKFGYRTLGEALQSLSGFYSSYDRNYSYLGIRGFSRPGDFNARALLLVDGFRVNDPVYETGTIGTEFLLDIDLIDRIEIIRGPSSSMYGNNAFFGVINVITRKGSDIKGNEISGEAGSFNTFKCRFTHAPKQESGRDLIFSTSFMDSAGQTRLFYPEFNSPATNNGVAENRDYDGNSQAFLKYKSGHFTVEGAFGRRTKGIPTGSYGTVFNSDGNSTTDEYSLLSLQYLKSSKTNGDLTIRLNQFKSQYQGKYNYDFAAAGDPPSYAFNFDVGAGMRRVLDCQWTKKCWERHLFIIGTEFKDTVYMNQSNYDLTQKLDDNRSFLESALFIQDEYKICSKLSLSAGIRDDRLNQFGERTNPRFALVFNPAKSSVIKLLSGQAFRAPNGYERYYQDGGLTQKVNPNLQPETNDTLEGVYEKTFSDGLFGSVSLYKYKIKNLISLVRDPVDNLMFFQNLDSVEARGSEVSLKKQWEDGKECRFNCSWQTNKDQRSGEMLSNSPNRMAKLLISVPMMQSKFNCGLETQYMSTRKTLAGNESGDVFLTNFTIAHRNRPKNVEFALSCYNLFGKTYFDPGAEEHIQDKIEQNGRTFRVKGTYFF
ncbi:MAG: TonB-dependent receptor [Candidatus Riflebacteria bacterium]|nr:TonB-dependent receptor [Candidatus Riflebacteria bacterium]